MCLFSWNRWSCGHFEKTRIEYCPPARDLPPSLRERNINCHKPDDRPEFSKHIKETCSSCAISKGVVSAGELLPYVQLRGSESSSTRKRTKPSSECEEMRQELRQAILSTKFELRRISATHADGAWTSLVWFSNTLFHTEDRYRNLGSKYYASGWFGNNEYQRLNPNEYATIENAFHGKDKHRKYLQPWRDLEAQIQTVLTMLASGASLEAYQWCYSGFVIAKTLYTSIENLKHIVDSINYYGDLYGRLRPDFALDLRQRDIAARNEAM